MKPLLSIVARNLHPRVSPDMQRTHKGSKYGACSAYSRVIEAIQRLCMHPRKPTYLVP